jgi:hypothetical protein
MAQLEKDLFSDIWTAGKIIQRKAR